MYYYDRVGHINGIVLLIDAFICGFILYLVIAKSFKRKMQKTLPKKPFKEQMKLSRFRVDYMRSHNFGPKRSMEILFLLLFLNLIFSFFTTSYICYPIVTLLASGVFFIRRKSVAIHYFWQNYLTQHPDNQTDIILVPLYEAKRIDKLLTLIGIINLIATVILVIVIIMYGGNLF